MEPEYSSPRIEGVNWIDPELLHQFEYGFVRHGNRKALIGVLDLSRFPTVVEAQERLLSSSASLPEKRTGIFHRLWKVLTK